MNWSLWRIPCTYLLVHIQFWDAIIHVLRLLQALYIVVFILSVDSWLLNWPGDIPSIFLLINCLFLEKMVLDVLELFIVSKCRAESLFVPTLYFAFLIHFFTTFCTLLLFFIAWIVVCHLLWWHWFLIIFLVGFGLFISYFLEIGIRFALIVILIARILLGRA